MARIRSIKPELPHSESLGRVSRDARLLFILLFTVADDEGRTRGNSRMLASLLFPYDDDAPIRIPEWLMELEREKSIIVYTIDGNIYVQIAGWLDHQKIDRPTKSRLPPPPIRTKPQRRLAKPRERSSLDQGRDGIKEGIKDSTEPQAAAVPPASPVPHVITIPTNQRGEEFIVSQAHFIEFEKSYPAVDVRQELREMRAWSIANHRQRKTADGMLRFINAWLAKEQNKSSRSAINAKVSAHDKGTAGIAQWLADRDRPGTDDRTGTSGHALPTNGHEPGEVAAIGPRLLGRLPSSDTGPPANPVPRIPAKSG
jgi:hypothetical protein